LLDEYIGEATEFDDYKARLQDRFDHLRDDLLTPAQKTFLSRLNSPLDDRNAWLNSMAQAVVNKSLTALRDADESLLYDRFRRLMRELDNLTELTDVADIDIEREDVFSLRIGSLVDGLHEEVVRMPKTKGTAVEKVEKAIIKGLSDDLVVNIAALTNDPKTLLINGPRQTRTRYIGRQRQCRVGDLYASTLPRTRHRVLHLRYG
jgi:hypothetical protein